MTGNWGSPSHLRSGGSKRRRIALSIAAVFAGVVLIGVYGELVGVFDGVMSPEIAGPVVLILVLLILGVVFGLRPWSDR